MLQRKWLAMSVLSVALVAVWGGAEAQVTGLPFTKLVAPLTCTGAGTGFYVGKFVDVTAVPTNGEFPATVLCPGEPSGGKQCSQYNYDFFWRGVTPDDAFVSVSTNVDLVATSPNAEAIESPANKGDSETGLGAGIWEQRTVRFEELAHPNPLHVSVTTSPSTPIPGTVAGTGPLNKFFTSCMIQVPGIPGPAQGNFANEQTFTTPPDPTNPNGIQYCAKTNPATGCLVVIDCLTKVAFESTPISVALTAGGLPVQLLGAQNQQCPTITMSDGQAHSTRVCSGSVCYTVPKFP